MGGPIVRTGTTPEFWQNWDKAFGKAAAKSKKAGLDQRVAKLEKIVIGVSAGKSKKAAPAKPTAKKPAKSAKSKPAGRLKKKKK
jgi:hypothetical protein